MKNLPRGIRNNNPGNIRHGSDWVGLSSEQPDKYFCSFSTPQYGIRALAKVLRTYKNKYGLKTVAGILKRYAPVFENDTGAYIDHACKVLNVHPDEEIDIFDEKTMLALIRTIIQHENGQQPYAEETILEGIRMS